MALSSMTGFARSHGASGPYTFEWELKSVNAKGFDLRMRLPPGWDELEALAKWHESRHELLPLPLAQVLERLREAIADANRIEAREAKMEEHRARWAAEVAAKAADPR